MATQREQIQEYIDYLDNNTPMHNGYHKELGSMLNNFLQHAILDSERVRGQLSQTGVDDVITINTANTPIKVDSITENGIVTAKNVTVGSNGRLTTTSPEDHNVWVHASVVISGNTGTKSTFYIAKNGSIIEQSKGIVRATNNNDQRQTEADIMVEATDNDYFELFVENNDTVDDITIHAYRLNIRS